MTDPRCRRFLSLCPRRRLPWELNGANRAVVFKPRLGEHPLARRIEGLLKLQPYRIRLDGRGTLVWASLDGSTPLSATLDLLRRELGDDQEQAEERLKKFVDQMFHSRLIEL